MTFVGRILPLVTLYSSVFCPYKLPVSRERYLEKSGNGWTLQCCPNGKMFAAKLCSCIPDYKSRRYSGYRNQYGAKLYPLSSTKILQKLLHNRRSLTSPTHRLFKENILKSRRIYKPLKISNSANSRASSPNHKDNVPIVMYFRGENAPLSNNININFKLEDNIPYKMQQNTHNNPFRLSTGQNDVPFTRELEQAKVNRFLNLINFPLPLNDSHLFDSNSASASSGIEEGSFDIIDQTNEIPLGMPFNLLQRNIQNQNIHIPPVNSLLTIDNRPSNGFVTDPNLMDSLQTMDPFQTFGQNDSVAFTNKQRMSKMKGGRVNNNLNFQKDANLVSSFQRFADSLNGGNNLWNQNKFNLEQMNTNQNSNGNNNNNNIHNINRNNQNSNGNNNNNQNINGNNNNNININANRNNQNSHSTNGDNINQKQKDNQININKNQNNNGNNIHNQQNSNNNDNLAPKQPSVNQNMQSRSNGNADPFGNKRPDSAGGKRNNAPSNVSANDNNVPLDTTDKTKHGNTMVLNVPFEPARFSVPSFVEIPSEWDPSVVNNAKSKFSKLSENASNKKSSSLVGSLPRQQGIRITELLSKLNENKQVHKKENQETFPRGIKEGHPASKKSGLTPKAIAANANGNDAILSAEAIKLFHESLLSPGLLRGSTNNMHNANDNVQPKSDRNKNGEAKSSTFLNPLNRPGGTKPLIGFDTLVSNMNVKQIESSLAGIKKDLLKPKALRQRQTPEKHKIVPMQSLSKGFITALNFTDFNSDIRSLNGKGPTIPVKSGMMTTDSLSKLSRDLPAARRSRPMNKAAEKFRKTLLNGGMIGNKLQKVQVYDPQGQIDRSNLPPNSMTPSQKNGIKISSDNAMERLLGSDALNSGNIDALSELNMMGIKQGSLTIRNAGIMPPIPLTGGDGILPKGNNNNGFIQAASMDAKDKVRALASGALSKQMANDAAWLTGSKQISPIGVNFAEKPASDGKSGTLNSGDLSLENNMVGKDKIILGIKEIGKKRDEMKRIIGKTGLDKVGNSGARGDSLPRSRKIVKPLQNQRSRHMEMNSVSDVQSITERVKSLVKQRLLSAYNQVYSPDSHTDTRNIEKVNMDLLQGQRRFLSPSGSELPLVVDPAKRYNNDSHVSDDICKGCTMDGGLGYIGHPTRCDLFVVCYPIGYDQFRAITQNCPFGQFWSRKDITCKPSKNVRCDNDICRRKLDGYLYPHHTNCISYWECQGGFSVSRCCPYGMAFDRILGCTKNHNCNDVCPDDGLYTWDVGCNKRSVPQLVTGYERYDSVDGWTNQTCGSGAVFKREICDCVPFHNAQPAYNFEGQCKPEVFLPFDTDFKDYSGSETFVRVENVTLINGAACFNGSSVLALPKFANMEFGRTVHIHIRYKQGDFGLGTEALLYNGDCKERQTMVIGSKPSGNSFTVLSKAQELQTIWVPSVVSVNDWREVRMVIKGDVLEGHTDTLSSSASIAGGVSRSTCGIKIGWGRGYSNFIGCIDEMSLYRCDPGYTTPAQKVK